MMRAAISFDGISKHYRGPREYRSLRDDLAGAAARVVGVRRPPRAVVRALDDVSFEIPEGQSLALIGPNGAGKTTSLKLATRIAYPTSGRLRVRGRVGALIEVGTGMHPELSGRENVQLYGRILGLSRGDVARRFDEIVDFAGIGPAIDQPVKQYSSGMQLRLGFSVAAHLEPDVLLVDEAIAVGDAGFQYRCVERMSTLVREGRTLVFVSHDMTAVETLCARAILLDRGRVVLDGPPRDVISAYLRSVDDERIARYADESPVGEGDLEIVRVSILDRSGGETDSIHSGDPMTVRLHYRALTPVVRPIFNVGLVDGRIGCFASASMLRDGGSPDVIAGEGYIDCAFDELPLFPRVYELWGAVRGEVGYGNLVAWQRLRLFRVESAPAANGRAAVAVANTKAPVNLPYRWHAPVEGQREVGRRAG
jgi:ABC-type polysaccharide/polyol phosphate transport system ATPase subunit